ncbi:hypothetical protein QEN19_000213 [Hanseniaspora menglaensis]
MGTYRKRFNEKARSGQIKKQNALKKIRNKQFTRHLEEEVNEENKKNDSNDDEDEDTNKEILVPVAEDEKLSRKRKLHDQIFKDQQETKISKQKRKRLEKYIDHQFAREEKKDVIKNLQKFKDLDQDMFISSKKIGLGTKAIDEEMEVAMLKNVISESEDSGSESDGDDDFDQKYGDFGGSSNTFIDNRTQSSTPAFSFGFGFNNIKVNNSVETKKSLSSEPKVKYNWKQNMKQMEKDQIKLNNENDFESSDEESQNEDKIEDNKFEYSQREADDEEERESKSVAKEFKDWATNQMKVLNNTEDGDAEKEYYIPNIKVDQVVHEEDFDDGLKESLIPVQENLKRKIVQVAVSRTNEIKKQRENLPVYKEEHTIMEAIHHNDIVIICGETGSGKTTQLPQFLYENGYGASENEDFGGMIGITQPRRVAAVSMANRVGNEMGDHKAAVAHQIRFDNTVDDLKTKMKFMTDGVLLREMMQDFKLTKYSAIIIDEAHERNINTDILIGMLSRCVRFREKENLKNPEKTKRLKLIIMSATLRVADFSENKNLFSIPPPIINVESRQFPVSVHFNKKTAYDYQEEAFKKACKIHQKLPKGGILMFLTGQQEILQMCKRLRKEFPFPDQLDKKSRRRGKKPTDIKLDANHEDIEVEDIDLSIKVVDEDEERKKSKYYEDDIKAEEMNDEVSSVESSDDDEEGFEESLDEDQTPNDPLYVLPLYSLLPTKEQLKVFEDPPKGARICIVATNVAETSITIPNMKYVIDCGRSKERKYDQEKNIQSFEIDWISKASANQRSGRAGRTGPGHCYKLYSSAIYESSFEDFSKPEILRMPIENVVLLMKSMNIHNIMNFPFPTLPDKESLSKAIKLLKYLGALEEEKITPLGKKMSLFPLNPRFSKMLLLSNDVSILPYVISIVCGLTIGNPFIDLNSILTSKKKIEDEMAGDDEDHRMSREVEDDIKKESYKYNKNMSKFTKLDPFSDIFKLLSCVCALDYIPKEKLEKFFADHYVRSKLMLEIMKLRKQIVNIIKTNASDDLLKSINNENLKTEKPNDLQIKLLKQIICSGFVDQVAIRGDFLYPEEIQIGNNTSISKIPYIPVLQSKENVESIADLFSFIHPESIINTCGQLPPKFLIYNTLLKNSDGSRTRMFPLCDIKSMPLVNIANSTSLIEYSKPITNLSVKPKDISLSERLCYVIPHFGDNDNDLRVSFDLNPVYVKQKRINGDWKVVQFINKK